MVHVVIISLGMEVSTPAPEVSYVTKGKIFKFDSANWGSSVAFFHESTMKALGGGFVFSRVLDQTLGTPIVASEVSTGVSSFTRVRSPAISFVNGNEYVVQFGVRSGLGHSGEIRGGEIIGI